MKGSRSDAGSSDYVSSGSTTPAPVLSLDGSDVVDTEKYGNGKPIRKVIRARLTSSGKS